MNLDEEILKNRHPEKTDWPDNKAERLKSQHKDNCMWHSSKRFKERMGHGIGYDELAVLAQLVQDGRSVPISKDQHLLRYGDEILRLVCCPCSRQLKPFFPCTT